MEFGINKSQLNTGRPIAMQCLNNVKKVKWPAAVDTGPFWNGFYQNLGHLYTSSQ